MRRFAVNMGLAFQVGGLIACSVLGSLFLGIWIDRRLGSAPCMMLVLMLIGLIFAMIGTYLLATKTGK